MSNTLKPRRAVYAAIALATIGLFVASEAQALPLGQTLASPAAPVEKAACWWVQGAWGPQQVCQHRPHYGYGGGHYDFHPGHWDRHYDHYDYHPGHWDYHHNGHRHHLDEY